MIHKTLIIRWIPRVLALGFILQILVLSLHGFGSEWDRHPNTTGFLYRLIPTLILLGLLVVAWKRRILGGVIFVLSAILFKDLFAGFLVTRTFGFYSELMASRGSVGLEVVEMSVVGALFIFEALLSGEVRSKLDKLASDNKAHRNNKLKRLSDLNS
jgi:hypothetical protein